MGSLFAARLQPHGQRGRVDRSIFGAEYAVDFPRDAFLVEPFIAEVFGNLGLNWRDYVQHDNSLMRPSDIEKSFANPEKAERKLGWKARYRMKDVARMMVEAENERLGARSMASDDGSLGR